MENFGTGVERKPVPPASHCGGSERMSERKPVAPAFPLGFPQGPFGTITCVSSRHTDRYGHRRKYSRYRHTDRYRRMRAREHACTQWRAQRTNEHTHTHTNTHTHTHAHRQTGVNWSSRPHQACKRRCQPHATEQVQGEQGCTLRLFSRFLRSWPPSPRGPRAAHVFPRRHRLRCV